MLTELSQKYKDRPYCRSGEISGGVDMNVSEVQRKFIGIKNKVLISFASLDFT